MDFKVFHLPPGNLGGLNPKAIRVARMEIVCDVVYSFSFTDFYL
jgi:hypothetical protein